MAAIQQNLASLALRQSKRVEFNVTNKPECIPLSLLAFQTIAMPELASTGRDGYDN